MAERLPSLAETLTKQGIDLDEIQILVALHMFVHLDLSTQDLYREYWAWRKKLDG